MTMGLLLEQRARLGRQRGSHFVLLLLVRRCLCIDLVSVGSTEHPKASRRPLLDGRDGVKGALGK